MSEPRIEAVKAAGWWAQQLGGGYTANGTRDPGSQAFQLFASAVLTRTFSDEDRAAFAAALAQQIEEHLQHWTTGIWADSWKAEQPSRGSANRALLNDYGPDRVLTDAADRAGVSVRRSDFPIKTVMWIDPGEVKVRCGYGAEVETVWQAGEQK